MDLQAATTVTDIQIGLTTTQQSQHHAPDPITLNQVRVEAVSVGIEAQPGSAVTLDNSTPCTPCRRYAERSTCWASTISACHR